MKTILTVAALAAAAPLFAQTATPAADPHAAHAGQMDCCKDMKDCCKDADGKAKADCCKDHKAAAHEHAGAEKGDAHAGHAPK